jgi:replicative superfamily II helicase
MLSADQNCIRLKQRLKYVIVDEAHKINEEQDLEILFKMINCPLVFLFSPLN